MTLSRTCTPDINVNIVICTRMMKDSVFCLVNVLFCVIYWNIYIYIYINMVQIAKRHTSPALAFNMQTRPNILPDLVFDCWKQAQDLCVYLLFVQYRYIPICNTKQYIYMYKTNYALCHHSHTYNKVYVGIGSTCMWWRDLNGQHSTNPASSVGRASDF